jgi:hypothetical protein
MKIHTNLLILAYGIVKTINKFIPKNPRLIYFMPHPNCIADRYDIINYKSDNALSLFNFMIRDKRFDNYTFYVQIFNHEKTVEYFEYCRRINPEAHVRFVLYFKKPFSFGALIKHLFVMFKASFIFTCHAYSNYVLKTSRQKTICLGYYTPFKNDWLMCGRIPKSASFYCHITTSMLSSSIISKDFGIDYGKFRILGFSRNDNLFDLRDSVLIHNEIKKTAGIGFEKMILYVPTFRDYEKSETNSRNIFGYEADYALLSKTLEEHNCLLIGKLHPWQNKKIIKPDRYKNIHILQPTDKLGLYDLMPVSDALITDYTSAYFDYLLLDKPVIFNFYDLEKYRAVRGFSYEPIEFFCAGEIVVSFEMLIRSISNVLKNNEDMFKEQRRRITPLFNKYSDNNSSARICAEIFGLKL